MNDMERKREVKWYGESSFDTALQTSRHYYTQILHAGLKHGLSHGTAQYMVGYVQQHF
jgi:hypothetical protein